MNETAVKSNPRRQRLLQRVRMETHAELEAARLQLQQRADYHPTWDYFLNLLMRPLAPDRLQAEVGRPLVKHLCNLAPYELFHAMGLHPLRLGSGCFCVGRLSASHSPVLMCPLLKATMGLLQFQASPRNDTMPWVVPTTCDWVVKFQELANTQPEAYFLELPHLHRGEKGQQRWLEEIYGLVRLLENQTGRKLNRKTLLSSVQIFMHAWKVFGRLIELRRKRVLAGVWFMVAANSFLLDSIEIWTERVHQMLETVATHPPAPEGNGVFLAGSPIIFPNFKLLHLIETAGMDVYGDDLCTSERIWPGAVCYEEPSYRGIMRALAERYHKACICPTFADNERRINSILNTLQQHHIRGVVYHVLKGCHPFDIESFNLEPRLKSRGYHFLKIETDYVQEDSQNILTRLEAFGRI